MLSCCQSLADEPTLVRRYNGDISEDDLWSQPTLSRRTDTFPEYGYTGR